MYCHPCFAPGPHIQYSKMGGCPAREKGLSTVQLPYDFHFDMLHPSGLPTLPKTSERDGFIVDISAPRTVSKDCIQKERTVPTGSVGPGHRKVIIVVDCSTSKQHASIPQGRTCSDNCTYHHTEIKVEDSTCISPSHSILTPG